MMGLVQDSDIQFWQGMVLLRPEAVLASGEEAGRCGA